MVKKSLIKIYIMIRAGVKASDSYYKALHVGRTMQKELQKEEKQA